MKRLYTFIVAIVDIVLLVIILKAVDSEKKGQQAGISDETVSVTAEIQKERPDTVSNDISKMLPSDKEDGDITENDDIIIEQYSINEESTEEITLPSATETEEPKTSVETTVTKAADRGDISDIKNYSTDENAEFADIYDLYLDGTNGFIWTQLSDDKVIIKDLSAVQGGWKAYIISNPEDPEHYVYDLMNINIGGSEEHLTVTLDWNYYYSVYSGEDGYSKEDDSVYTGTWMDGVIYAEGQGSISLYEFDYEKGKEYGIGTVFFPDGSYGFVALVRP